MLSPEEIELAKKRRELAELLEEQSQVERDLATVKADIRAFENSYQQALGGRIAELEQLEWEISGLLGTSEAEEEHQKYFHTVDQEDVASGNKTSILDDDADSTTIFEEKSLKSIYRDVAKLIHPDLAADDHERFRRQELMAIANLAYQEGDRQRLQAILKEWKLGPETVKGFDIGAELIRLIRQIAHTRQAIQDLHRRIDELRQSDIWCFKQRVDDSHLEGVDLLAEMATSVDLDITKARKRLALLRGDQETPQEWQASLFETRVIRFPAEKSCGTLYTRSATSDDYRSWQKFAIAKGVREIPLDQGLRLDVRGDSGNGIAFFDELKANDLQALFLYDVGDEALQRIAHLTGLQELYISNTTVSDEGLKHLQCLTGLKRLYLYHTAISDAGLSNLYPLSWLRWITFSGTRVTEQGLAELRQALPACKVITFKWRYE